MRYLFLSILIFSNFLLFSNENNFPLLEYSDGINPESPQTHLYLFEDSDDTETIEKVIKYDVSQFKRINDVIKQLKRNTSYWVVLRIKNITSEKKELLLISGLTQYIDFYVTNSKNQYELKKYGYDIPDAKQEYSSPISQIIGFEMFPGEEKLLYFRIKSNLNLKPSPLFKIEEREKYKLEIEEINLVQGFFHGLIWMLVLYVLFLYFNFRERVYLYYIVYSACFSIAIYILMGYPRNYLFPDITFNVLISEIIIQFGSVFYFKLFIEALDIKSQKPRLLKPLRLLMNFFFVGVLFTAIMFFIDFYIYNLLTQIFVFIELMLFALCLIILFTFKHPIIKYILIANLCLLVGATIIVVALLFFGEPFLKFFPVFQAGVAFEVLFYAIALSKKYQYVEEQKRLAQDYLIQELRDREEYQKRINDELEEKVQERTQEINQSKEEIEQQREYIEQRNILLEKSNSKLIQNLEYAGFVQNALMPDFEKIRTKFKDSFLFNLPQSYVSGDFYMFFELKNKKNLVVVADCTGHGVPAAMLTLIAQEFISEIVNEKKITEPSKILEELEKRISSRLLDVTSNRNLNEGLDISIILIDKAEMKIEFSGAKLPLIIIRNGILTKIRGDLFGIGGFCFKQDIKYFKKHELSFEEGDTIYMFTDGYHDQLNGKTNKKFMSKNFWKLLVEISDKSMEEQCKIITSSHQSWKGNVEQTDDILVLGLKL